MGERSEAQGAVAVILIALILILCLVGGGGLWFYTRHHIQLLRQMEMAQAAEARALLEAERAMLLEQQAKANLIEGMAKDEGTEISPATFAEPSEDVADAKGMESGIQSVIQAQRDAWNAGDVRAFMQHYWNSDQLTFSSGGKTTRGWSDTLQRYLDKYPDREAMGTLQFENIEIQPLGNQAALVLGNWHLERGSNPVGGNFSVIFRQIDGRWVIVHDHTSQLNPTE